MHVSKLIFWGEKTKKKKKKKNPKKQKKKKKTQKKRSLAEVADRVVKVQYKISFT